MNLDDTAAKLREYEYAFAMELAEYVERLRKQYAESPDSAKREAEEALMRTGVQIRVDNRVHY